MRFQKINSFFEAVGYGMLLFYSNYRYFCNFFLSVQISGSSVKSTNSRQKDWSS